MHLISTLAAGVKGAENGIAEIYERGTVARAAYSFDFEGDGGFDNTDLALDSHGGATVYVTQLCNVVVKTVGGAVLREFVAGVRDDCVEVESPAFSGNAYDNSSTGPGMPTTLAEVLDRWQIMNGGPDWQVDIPGVGIYPLGGAIANSFGLVFNVRASGAVGDGVANDTNAINAAIAEAITAGGGVVFFPPGVYRTTGGHVVDGRVSLTGVGPGAASIVLDNPAAFFLIRLTTSAAPNRFHVVQNLAMSSASAAPGAALLDVPGTGCRSILHNLHLDGTNFGSQILDISTSPVTELLCGDCVFQLATAARALSVTSSNAVKRIVLRDCRFITPATFTSLGVVRSASLDIQGCVFDNSATATGTYSCIETSGSPVPAWSVAGCQFINSAGASVTAMNWAAYGATASVVESDNTFGSTVTAYSYTVPSSRGAQIQLRSRELRSIFIADATAAPVLPLDQYGMVLLTSSINTTPTVFQTTKMPPDGARGTIVIVRTAATPGTVTAGANFMNPSAIATVQNGTYLWEYRVGVPVTTPRFVLSVDGRICGTGL
jgi:hypothetical protein